MRRALALTPVPSESPASSEPPVVCEAPVVREAAANGAFPAPSGPEAPAPARLRRLSDYEGHTPVHVVWEITLACNLKCLHCGSRAGKRRPDELSTEECLEVVESLARLGTREITLIGGEAYLRNDWVDIVAAARSHDMYCGIQTGGRSLTDRRLQAGIDAGLQGLGVSVDGLEELHDRFRGVPGSYRAAMSALRRAKAAGLKTSANTAIGSPTMPDLEGLLDRLIEVGVTHWQVQLVVAMGNAADNDELLLQPHRLEELMPLLARLYMKGLDHGLLIIPGNNVGYFGPYEHLFRGVSDPRTHWSGCSAGQTTIALEADGTVKGCPSLPTVGYAGGNVRDLSLEEIWAGSPAIHFGRLRSVRELSGFCATCYYADVCRGGCTWTVHSLLGSPGNNPYCHYRVTELAKHGLRERVVKRRDAAPAPFAVGEFDLVIEPIPGAVDPASPEDLERLGPRPPESVVEGWLAEPAGPPGVAPERGRVPPTLAQCAACYRFVWPQERTCPFCGVDLDSARRAEEAERARRAAVMSEVRALIDAD
jgi:Y-X(10)_GDL-associated radical SAM protein